VAGESDSAAVWNVYKLALDSDRVDEPVCSWYEEGRAEESLPNSETADGAKDEGGGGAEETEVVVSEMAGPVTGSDKDLWLVDIDEERSG
jgi:hypothetical protein